MAGSIDNRVQAPPPTPIVQGPNVTAPAPPPNTVPPRAVSGTETQPGNPAQAFGVGGVVSTTA